MGNHPNIKIDKFPEQGSFLHREVMVLFHYDTSKQVKGIVVRDDIESPYKMIIALDDGRFVMAEECQWHD